MCLHYSPNKNCLHYVTKVKRLLNIRQLTTTIFFLTLFRRRQILQKSQINQTPLITKPNSAVLRMQFSTHGRQARMNAITLIYSYPSRSG